MLILAILLGSVATYGFDNYYLGFTYCVVAGGLCGAVEGFWRLDTNENPRPD